MALNIYRYNFEDEFAQQLYIFAKIHQYDNRHDFKEAWNVWIDDNNDMIELEINRLISLEYNGNILDKMFKSARYYFRKKKTAQKEPTKRREYTSVDKEVLYYMTEHIIKNIANEKYKPSDGFANFCKHNAELVLKEIKNLYCDGSYDGNEIKAKLKKTYKNRYYIISKNMKKIKTPKLSRPKINNE